MRSRKVKFLIPAIMIIIFIFLTACAKTIQPQVPVYNNSGRIKLRCVISSQDSNKIDAFSNFATDIKTILPDYDISFEFIKGDLKAYKTKIKVLMSTDNVPDVFLSSDESFSDELYGANLVQPIEKYLDQLKFWDMVLPSAKVQGYNNHIYAIPIDPVSYQIIEVNTDLFTQNNINFPQTFNDLQTAVSIFKSKGIIPIAVGGKDGKAVYNMLEGFAYTIDPQITSKIINGTAKFSDAPFKQSATKVKELLDMGAFGPDVAILSDQDAANLFHSGKAAMYCTNSSDFATADALLNGKCGLLYYPTLNNIPTKLSSSIAIAGGITKNCGLLISAASTHPAEATKLAIEVSKYYNKYLYEKQNNVAIIYLPDYLGWKLSNNPSALLQQLMQTEAINLHTSAGFMQNALPDAQKKAIIEDSSAFMTGLLSADNYLKKIDNGLTIK